eukprot:TRINITY_DN29542_c0_g1_i1.p1 TRINITY_DN29542_c0_g1~~TRINITY_DN29542_c0_g1_i1.p1  ORF type:complete len:255 (+),score=42.01 TRINITY_DN29542_c0_g1_i1:66-830(+)
MGSREREHGRRPRMLVTISVLVAAGFASLSELVSAPVAMARPSQLSVPEIEAERKLLADHRMHRRIALSVASTVSVGILPLPATAKLSQRIQNALVGIVRATEDLSQMAQRVNDGGVTGKDVKKLVRNILQERSLSSDLLIPVQLGFCGECLPYAKEDDENGPAIIMNSKDIRDKAQPEIAVTLQSFQKTLSDKPLQGEVQSAVIERLSLANTQLISYLNCVKKKGYGDQLSAATSIVEKEVGSKGKFPWRDTR